MWYPKWVYHYREDLTRENMRKYEEWKNEYVFGKVLIELFFGKEECIENLYQIEV